MVGAATLNYVQQLLTNKITNDARRIRTCAKLGRPVPLNAKKLTLYCRA